MTISKLEEIHSDKPVFVDAPIFVYHFTGSSRACREFLLKCEKGELRAVTSTTVLAETTHRLMMIEAVSRKLVTLGNVAQKLRKRPATVRKLRLYQEQVEKIPLLGIEIVPLDLGIVLSAAALRAKYGLMTNDSLIVATLLSRGIEQLASADSDFAAIDGITVYRPDDLELE
ncbi:MAG TPA: PIN domain-containing protein [Acidobacteriota bacterium]|nr:PIN domain-containing protein [Acidobacteriota bacterium]